MSQNKLKSLQKQWYAKLAASGFQDIETPNGLLKDWDSLRFSKPSTANSSQQVEATRKFYSRAEHFLYSFRFPNKIHRRLWELFSKGHSLEEIVSKLATEDRKSLSKSQVSRILLQYRQFIE